MAELARRSLALSNAVGGSRYLLPLVTVTAILVLLLPCLWLAARIRGAGGVSKAFGAQLVHRCHGATLVLLVVVLFTSSTIVTQLVFDEQHYRKPFFVTLLCFSTQSIYLLAYRDRTARAIGRTFRLWRGQSVRVGPGRFAYDAVETGAGPPHAPDGLGSCGIAWRLGAILLSANLLFNVSLQLTSVSACTIISSSSAVWTLLFSAWRLGEPLTLARIASVVCGTAGVVIVVSNSQKTEDDTHGRGWGGGGWRDEHHLLSRGLSFDSHTAVGWRVPDTLDAASVGNLAPARSAIREDGAASLSVRADGPDRPAAHPISPWGSPPRRSRALCPAPGRRARGGDGQRAARHCARQCATSSRDDAHLAAGGGGRLVPLDPGGRRLRRHARPGRAVQGAAGGRGGGVGGLPRRRGLGGHVGRGAAGSCVCEVPVAVQAIHRTTVEGVARRK
eukprot:scaffold23788_cov126-Isochrysis_galbana.AAC.5